MSPLPNMVKKATGSSLMPDWSLLPDELLHIITEKMNNCFDVVHARSVCSSWRSTFAFPCSLVSPSYSLPMFKEPSFENEGLCTLKKIPLFLFSVNTPSATCEYFLGGIGRRDESEDQIELPSPELQCSVKIPGPSDQTSVNMLDCQILSLGYEYRMFGWEPEDYIGAAFLPLNKEGGGEFVVLVNCSKFLLVLTSAEMRWKRLENVPKELCWELVTFRGRFYASFRGEVAVIDPYSLDVSHLMPPQPLKVIPYLVPSGNDELFLVQLFFLPGELELNISQLACRVRRLDEEEGKWVEVNDLGDRVLFIHHGHLGNVCCSAKELPHGCGLSRNSILITYQSDKKRFSNNRGSDWRFQTGNFVVILNVEII